MLFLISYLHQTTTDGVIFYRYTGCFLSRIYIKPQPHDDDLSTNNCCFLSRIYIKPQPIFLTFGTYFCCFLSRIYIKPQLRRRIVIMYRSCFLSRIYIKPQLASIRILELLGCFLSRIYIKPQPVGDRYELVRVVSYLVSTSNHNGIEVLKLEYLLFLISYLHQTTTIP